jgi:hypothetical protein
MSHERRKLSFDNFEQVERDLDALATGGYDQVGRWDLGQMCAHLDDWLRYPLDGYPKPPAPLSAVFWLLRKTVIPGQLRKVLATGEMKAGAPTFKETVHRPGGDALGAVDRLKQTIGRWKTHKGPMQPSPLFGSLDRESMERLQRIHLAHHLSFLRPKG